ncbi:Soluble epoxide hydrolase [Roseovarius sp. THAF27]|uniref:alpha/beta fold hydrolase BchO n=1 Tax=Roseovarius sp. THAF27 TaxID=2587850 RepID=UPI001268EF9F|nr:alpha/beta fold hydrolase BchO [Roseovarius sp. THAF27]QFT81793.1 Soluble epoxide hydrolase [Roseovarius sp. THAF27]
MDWARDLPDWPHADASRRVRHRPHDWHVQEWGTGPTLLLLHGAGASTHTWRDLIPRLSENHHIIALDLPGHGFTRAGSVSRLGLATTAEDIAALCADQNWQPQALIGHSAGAAVALDLATRLPGTPAVIGLNAALDRFEGMAGWLFPMLAKLLALNPLTAIAFSAGGARLGRARNVIRATGSTLSEEGLAWYSRLLADRAHVDSTLQMMSRWSTDALLDHLPEIESPVLLVTGDRDTAVAPEVSDRAAALLPNAERIRLDGLGHLAHEEDPDRLCDIMLGWLRGKSF